jgi:acyl-coenzyme A thioesterase PaaI-like protein
VEAEAHIAKRGRTISLGEAVVRQGERLVAKAMCTYIHLAIK